MRKGRFGAIVKLLSCDFVVIDLSCGNNLLQCRIILRTMDLIWSDPFPELHIGGSFVHQLLLFLSLKERTIFAGLKKFANIQ